MAPALPSVTGLDRSNWEPVLFEVPVNGVAHSPTYAPPTFDLAGMPRQRGDEPTIENCLDLGEADVGAEIGQAFRSHGLAVLDAALLVPRLIIRPPHATDWSPRWPYERAPSAAITAPWCDECGSPCAGGCDESCGTACDGAAPTTPVDDPSPAPNAGDVGGSESQGG
ncbi:MAG: hypothetical protein IPJ41_13615 [Phycisphaerales bacterium]|nr:hypothetical protein [Phycisphaerales bacterium]